MEVINHFSSECLTIFETKNNAIPDTAPKSDKYQWILVQQARITFLHFKSMESGLPVFQEGILRFDKDHASYNGAILKSIIVSD